MKLLLYCPKGKPYLRDKHNVYGDYHCFPEQVISAKYLNGKIGAECDFEVEDIRLIETPEYAGSECNTFVYDVSINFETKTLNEDELCKKSCLNACELNKYLDLYKEREIYGYAIHIKNLHIFNEPRELSDLRKGLTKEEVAFSCIVPRDEEWIELGSSEEILRLSYLVKKLENAPKNMRYCYYFNESIQGWEKAITLNVKPEELCRILKEEQTIIVRRNVLKGMLK